jgi:hypothetical protein
MTLAAQVHSPSAHSSPGAVQAPGAWLGRALRLDPVIAFHSVHTTILAGAFLVLLALARAALSNPGDAAIGLGAWLTGASQVVFP